MIQEMNVISKDCYENFEAAGDEDDEVEYYYEENKVEETLRRQTSLLASIRCVPTMLAL